MYFAGYPAEFITFPGTHHILRDNLGGDLSFLGPIIAILKIVSCLGLYEAALRSLRKDNRFFATTLAESYHDFALSAPQLAYSCESMPLLMEDLHSSC